MVDEAHRSQEGDYGSKMREALPNAFLFGLTGTPINKRDRNTFMWFGSKEDDGGYLSRYTFQDSIRDGATLPLHFEPRLSEIHLDQEAIDAAFAELADRYRADRAGARLTSRRRLPPSRSLIKAPERIAKIAADIAEHFRSKVEPQGLKAQVVVYDKPTCVAYKAELDEHLGPDASTDRDEPKTRGDRQLWTDKYTPDRDELEQITSPLQRPCRSAEDHHRHRQAADGL